VNSNPFSKFIVVVAVLYFLVASIIFAPLYNWRYARDNGVVKWVLFGEIVATAKAIIWPYYVFFDKPKTDVNDYPKLTADEIDATSIIFSKAQIEVLTINDIAALKRVLKEYNERTGTKIKKTDVEALTKTLEITNEYYYEFGQSLLNSWDSKSKFTTRNFDKVLRLVKEYEVRKPEKIKMDLACLEAAARNQNYVQNEEGRKFEFGREMILQKLHENEISRNNFERIKKALNADIAQ
jgi:hypothetical protein